MAALCSAVVLVTLPSPPASAQGLFQSLFGALTGRQRAPSPTVNSYAEPLDVLPRMLESPEDAPRVGTAHCVRLCDGYHFVLPRGQTRSTSAELCSALCPAAEVRVFHGAPGAIEQAVAANGQRYADLANALAYRDRQEPDCTCNKRGSGIATIDALSDPTLREGDIVVTASGPVVFRGSRNFPYKSADFTPAAEYRGLPVTLREQLATMRIADAPQPPSREVAHNDAPTPSDPPRYATPFWQTVVDRPPLASTFW